ncbi:DUF421 domain-containing protein [Algoriphagus antarcticus]|uniref:Uncharacterized protein DUF421 n=1 Tax=Algoriphagus antarcticus TaxID=238540 RepID=A0A3E0E1C0_9BACT|nr:YetF domain-containing protein [Algoriphagus antarcticus]REG90696.1 uncharacterized protein DUF421 [Algoriphagus antarcticus]
MENIFFSGWEGTVRTIILTVLGYVAIVIILRISGKRTLSKMNAFDFVVTVALGSCLASISLNKNISLLDGVLSFSLFIFMQFLLTYLSVKVEGFRTFITSKPTIVFYGGRFLHKEMKKERLSKEEILNAGRLQGFSNLDDVYVIILETTGDLSIIEKKPRGKVSTIPSLGNFLYK